MNELHRRILQCYGSLGLQDIDEDVYVDNLPEVIDCLPHKLKFPIHASLKQKIAFYSPEKN